MNFEKFAERIIGGELAKQELERQLSDYFFGEDADDLFKIGDPYIMDIYCDTYDNSIEINLQNIDNPREFCLKKITKEFSKNLLQSGCSHFWINFYAKDKLKIAEYYVTDDIIWEFKLIKNECSEN